MELTNPNPKINRVGGAVHSLVTSDLKRSIKSYIESYRRGKKARIKQELQGLFLKQH